MKTPAPLELIRRFFRWYCHPAFVEDLEGDLEELYRERMQRMSARTAQWHYVWDVLLLFRPSIIRPFTLRFTQSVALFRSYAQVGFRHMLKHKSYTLLNIIGLAIGIAATTLLFLIVQYEKSFDTFHSNYQNIYQLGERRTSNGKSNEAYLTRTPAFPAMRNEYPEVVGGSRFDENRHKISYGDRLFLSSVHYVDTSFATTFDFPTLSGDAKQALHTPNHLVLTEGIAKKFFDHEDPIGKVLDIDQGGEDKIKFTVGAVVQNPPPNSSLQFEILIPWLNAPAKYNLDQYGIWQSCNMTTFIQLTPGTNSQAFEKKLEPFKEKYYTKYEGYKNDIILHSWTQVRSETTQNQALTTLLGAIAVIILLVASINFMNLSTAQSLERVKEIDLRKAMGSRRGQLIGQFLTESTLTSLFALLIAVGLVYIALPWVNEYFELALALSFWKKPLLLVVLAGIVLVTGLLAGLYPAFFVSGFHSAKSLGREWKRGFSGQFLQKGLIIVQYACSILLIAGTLVIWRQTYFMKTQDLNLDHHNIIAMRVYGDKFKDAEQAKSRLKVLRDELKGEAIVKSIAFSKTVPGNYLHSYNNFYPAGQSVEAQVNLRKTRVDDRYFPAYGISFTEGRNSPPTLLRIVVRLLSTRRL